MPRVDLNIVTQRQQFPGNRIQQLLARTSWKIRAPHRSGEENIANKNLSLGWLIQNHVPRRVAWTMKHFKLQLTH